VPHRFEVAPLPRNHPSEKEQPNWFEPLDFGNRSSESDDLQYKARELNGAIPTQRDVIFKLGFNQDYYTFSSILLIKIVLCIKFP